MPPSPRRFQQDIGAKHQFAGAALEQLIDLEGSKPAAFDHLAGQLLRLRELARQRRQFLPLSPLQQLGAVEGIDQGADGINGRNGSGSRHLGRRRQTQPGNQVLTELRKALFVFVGGQFGLAAAAQLELADDEGQGLGTVAGQLGEALEVEFRAGALAGFEAILDVDVDQFDEGGEPLARHSGEIVGQVGTRAALPVVLEALQETFEGIAFLSVQIVYRLVRCGHVAGLSADPTVDTIVRL